MATVCVKGLTVLALLYVVMGRIPARAANMNIHTCIVSGMQAFGDVSSRSVMTSRSHVTQSRILPPTELGDDLQGRATMDARSQHQHQTCDQLFTQVTPGPFADDLSQSKLMKPRDPARQVWSTQDDRHPRSTTSSVQLLSLINIIDM